MAVGDTIWQFFGALKHYPWLYVVVVVVVCSLKLGVMTIGDVIGRFLALSNINHICMYDCCANLFA
jgi:hypothetical protein